MERWVYDTLAVLDMENVEVVKLMDKVNLVEEQHVDGAEKNSGHDEDEDDDHDDDYDNHDDDDYDHDEEYDEHIWSSPANAIIIMQELAKILSELDNANKEFYNDNAGRYIAEIKRVQADIQKIVDNRVRDRIVFGDKMPMQYFLDEFGLTATAAFTGCSTVTEPAISTIRHIIDRVKEENISVILYIELSSGTIARTIAEGTEAEMMQIQTLHNVSKEDFQNEETYVSLWERNLEVLRKALL
jgi:zinc transport system substrate-binding protein